MMSENNVTTQDADLARQSDRTTVALFAACAMFLAIVQFLILGASVIGAQMSAVLSATILMGALVGAALFGVWFARKDASLVPPASSREAKDASPPVALGVLMGLAMLWAFIVYVWLFVLAANRPPALYDELSYHVPAIHKWVLEGRVHWFAVDPKVNGFPMAVEVMSFFSYYLLGSEHLLNASNLLFLPVAVLGLTIIANTFGVRGLWAWFASSLFLFVPVVVTLGATCLVDVAFACAVIGVLASMCLILRQRERIGWRHALLWGANAGLMIGCKGTGAPFLVVSATVLLFVGFGYPMERSFAKWLALLAAGLTAALLVGGFWYARNLVMTGDPVYPFQVSLGKWTLIPGEDPHKWTSIEPFLTGDSGIPAYVRRWPRPLMFLLAWVEPLGASHHALGGLGHFWCLVAIPSIVVAWVLVVLKHRKGLAGPLLVVTVSVAAMFALQPGHWWARLTLWLYALGLPCFGLVFQTAFASARGCVKRALVAAACLGLVALSAWEGLAAMRGEWQGLAYLRKRIGSSEPIACTPLEIHLNALKGTVFEEVMKSNRVARTRMTVYGCIMEGHLSMPLGKRRIVALPEQCSERDPAWSQAKKSRWLIWSLNQVGEPPEFVRRAARSIHRLAIRQDDYIYVIELKGAEDESGSEADETAQD